MEKDIILDVFWDEYLRSPTINEYCELGGSAQAKIMLHGTWNKYLKEMRVYTAGKRSYNVIDPDTNEVVFCGAWCDITNEFDISVKNSPTSFTSGERLLDRRYIVQEKPFDKERIRNILKSKMS